MVRTIIIGLVVIIAAAAGRAFLLPQNVHVERSTVIAAAPDQVFAVVNDLTRAKEWGPWYKRDPNMKLTFDGPPAGVGAKLSWDSESEGKGSQEIIGVEMFRMVKTKIEFLDNGSTAIATFRFANGDTGTKA